MRKYASRVAPQPRWRSRPCFARAEGPSYSFVEAGCIVTDVDDFDEEFDGFSDDSVARSNSSRAGTCAAGYIDQSAEIFGVDVDPTGFDVGVGYAFPLTDAIGSLRQSLATRKSRSKHSTSSVDDDGYELGVGLRASVMEQLELEGAVDYVDLSDSGDDTSFGVAARSYFMPQFALGIEGELGDDADSYGVSARWEFGRPVQL